jgi:hypothetical protein
MFLYGQRFFMRWQIAILVAGLLMAGCAGPPKHARWGNATGGEQHERLMWQAIHDKDWAQVERHLSPTFVGVNAEGQMLDHAGWIAYWKNSQQIDFSLGELAVQPEGADMKVTSIIHIQGGANKALGASGGLRVISIWQQIKKRWALTATSITPIQND